MKQIKSLSLLTLYLYAYVNNFLNIFAPISLLNILNVI